MRLLLLATVFAACVFPYVAAGRFVCYFPNWAIERQKPWQFGVDNIDTKLCTHLVYAFADLDETTFKIKPNNPAVDIDQEFYRKFTGLKSQNPSLKTMLAVGGWVDSNINDKYSQLVASRENIDVFVGSVVSLLKEYGFDGLDMDWEYPKSDADKTGFINLMVALKDAFAPFNYILSAAVAPITTDLGYDIPALETTADFINLMTYDMHGSWEPDVADHHAPLRKRSFETIDYNVESSVHHWITNGLSASKINLGMPLYGRSWKLASAVTTPPAPAVGVGAPGPFTKEEGYVSYFEICQAVQNEGWQVVQDPDQFIGPYALSPTDVVNWIGYDDITMLTTKSNYVLSKGLGGAMVWEISLDDYRGACGAGMNPLLTAISRIVVA
ncbi:chitotriosidase-1-like [Daphnia magna]|uniref:chitotriosidase-1 n=1 Tax=Daphnia magna TaxID=35525 RepID=UPI001E1BA143|nr:chitotriosidase-1 [Daphnia magna]XP_045036347.1 chitotriosidase-1-like [Daphnia magna]